jgi:hypothetical protein
MMPPLIKRGAKSWTRIEHNIVVLSLHIKMEGDTDKSIVELIRAPLSTTLWAYSLLYNMMVSMTMTRPRRRPMTLVDTSQVRMVSMGLSLHLWWRMELRASSLPPYA